ncbi:MAG: tetratricopeptide repeat protein [Proteobacteria bacterium]|nr:tetratricopeptide repeat protein [Pseudomonadota bacterium]
MSALKCRVVEDHFDDFLEGGMTEKERVKVEMHLGTCESCRQSLAVWKGFVHSIRNEELDTLPPMFERRLAIAAAAERGPESRNANWKRWATVSCGFAAAAVVALVLALQGTGLFERADSSAVATLSNSNPEIEEDLRSNLLVTTAEDGRRVIAVSPGTNLWLDKDAAVQVQSTRRDLVRFRLDKGRVVAEVKPPIPGYRFIVATPSGEVEAKGTVFSVEVTDEGRGKARVLRGVVEVRRIGKNKRLPLAILTLKAGQEGSVGDVVPVTANKVAVQLDECLLTGCPETNQADVALLATEIDVSNSAPTIDISATPTETNDNLATRSGIRSDLESTKKSPLKARRTGYKSDSKTDRNRKKRMDSLVSLALAKRKVGKYPEAAEIYRRLIDEYPRSGAAQNALVSLGQLELKELGRPGRALKHFEDYLSRAPKGFLAEEARLGQVRSSGRLGRLDDVERTATAYLKTHSNGYAGAEVLRRRGDARRKLGNCEGATEDYRKIQIRWPGSHQNKLAAKGLAECEP